MPRQASFYRTLKHYAQMGYLRNAGAEMMVGAIVLLVAGMLLMWANQSKLHQIDLASQRSDDALTQVAMVDSEILGIELALRSYTIKPRPVYVESYHNRVKRLRRALDRLRVVLADQPKERPRVIALYRYTEGRIDIFNHLLKLDKKSQHILEDTVTDLKLRAERQNAQKLLDDIRSDEMADVKRRQSDAEHNVQQSLILSTGIVAFAFVLSLIGLMLVRGAARPPDFSA
jgi:CHASE3 domain sensor protein